MGGSTCRSGPGGLLPSRFAGHPRGCAPSTGAQGIRPRSHREIRALALGPSHDGNGASLAGSAGSCPDPAPYGPWPRRARLAHSGPRRGTCRSTRCRRSPAPSPASALVRIRCCRRSSRASNCSGLTSCRTRARVLVALLEGPPLPGQISGYKNRTDDALSREPFHKS